jgi:phosphoglycerate dehydrogenase-like enzyme
LTNAKGAFNESLAEFVMLGVLYHTKKVEKFMRKKQERNFDKVVVGMASQKVMGIVGYGDIGVECARIAKKGFNMRIIGLKRDPKSVNEEARQFVDEIVGEDQLDYVL